MSNTYLRNQLGSGASLERLRAITHEARPASVRTLMSHFMMPIHHEGHISTDAPLGAFHKVVLRRDGSWEFQGHFRATGFYSYKASLATYLTCDDGTVIVFSTHGEAYGTNSSGERQFNFNQAGNNPLIYHNWAALRNASLRYELQYDENVFGVFGDALALIVKATAAIYTGGAAGAMILIGTETIDALNLHELSLPGTVGLFVIGGILWVGGPGALLTAIVAGTAVGAATASLVKQRRLSDEEYDFVDRVFKGTLPRDRILLTNLTGIGERPFTTPGPGNAILVNLGVGYDDPIRYTGYGAEAAGDQAPGQLLIHELTHAWQIAQNRFIPGLMCRGILNQVGTLGGNMDTYKYGPANKAWSEFNLEQQGSIVDQWFGGNGSQHKSEPMTQDDINPYWRYVRDNIRTGIA